ncbi:MAG: hypothetical protein J1F35_06260 [Erysipelotrichales bacterium]|nr:hypothetical protein [Erysipelotrichales bacterium]
MAKKKDKEFEYEYNPVKEQIGGKGAEKVIWTTKSLNMAVEAISQGLPLKANPFCGKNTKLLRPDLVYKRTQEEIEDYIKCKEDPVYFGEKCYLMTPEGLQQCKLRGYQKKYLEHLKNNRFTCYLAARQVGKTLNMSSIVNIFLNKNSKYIDKLIRKYFFYIKDNLIYIQLPLFELWNIYGIHNKYWKIKYQLYKIIYKLKTYEKNSKRRKSKKN